VTLKLATSLDGRIAAGNGTSQWITGAQARARVHRLRADADAVLVGSGTALADDPRLTPRDVPGAWLPPLRVVLDSQLRVPASAQAYDPAAPGGALVATALPADAPAARALAERGVAVWSLPGGDGRVDLWRLMERLGAREPAPITALLVEGGGIVAGALLAAGLVHKLVLHMAPVVVGGDGLPAFGPLGLAAPADGPRLHFTSVERVGDDLEIVAYPHPG